MAKVVRDPREHPDAIIPDFSKPDPVLTFTKDDVAFAIRQPLEAALFHPPGQRLLPTASAVDITHSRGRPTMCRIMPIGAALS